MRVRRNLKNGVVLTYGGRLRYAVFRLTLQGAFSVHSDNSALDCVKWACDKHNDRGFKYLVLDTHTADLIACYPKSQAHLYFGVGYNDRQLEDDAA